MLEESTDSSEIVVWGAFACLSLLYGALDTILFIVLCSHENNSSPPHSTLGTPIQVRNLDRKVNHGRFILVLEAKLGSSKVTRALSSPCSICLIIVELSMCATCPGHLRRRDRWMEYSDWMPALLSTSVFWILSYHLISKIFLKYNMKAIRPSLLTSIQGQCLTPAKECWQAACLVDKSLHQTSTLPLDEGLTIWMGKATAALKKKVVERA